MKIGDSVGQYRITASLGEGGMGEVYKAMDTMIEREVAIKALRPEISRQNNLLQRFRSEAVTLAKLNNSGIAMLYSFLQQGDEFFMILEYVPGKTLEAVERERGALDAKTALPLFAKMLEAVQYAHDMGILHRDIKPANIMLTTWGTVKLMDFGIARVLGAARQTRDGALVGTMEYVAPERVKGSEGGPAADIYSLGVVLYEMLTGRLPFISDNEYEMMRMHLENTPPTFGELGLSAPDGLEQMVQRALAKKPEDRFSTCDDFLEALHEVSGATVISKREVIALVGQMTISQLGTAGHRVSSSAETLNFDSVSASASEARSKSGQHPLVALAIRRRNPLLAGLAAIVAVAIGLGAGMLSRKEPEDARPAPVQQVRQSTPYQPQDPQEPRQAPVSEVPVNTPVNSLPLVPPAELNLSGDAQPGAPGASRPKAPARHHEDVHAKSLKALDQ